MCVFGDGTLSRGCTEATAWGTEAWGLERGVRSAFLLLRVALRQAESDGDVSRIQEVRAS